MSDDKFLRLGWLCLVVAALCVLTALAVLFYYGVSASCG